VFFRTCAGWGLFGIVLLIGLWFIIRPDELWSDKQTAQKEKEQTVESKQNESIIQTQKENSTLKEAPITNSTSDQDITIENRSNQTTITTKTKSSEIEKLNIVSSNNKNNNSNKQLTIQSSTIKADHTKNKKAVSLKHNVVSKKKGKDKESDAIAKTDAHLNMPDGFKSDDNPAPPTGLYPSDSTLKKSEKDTTQNGISTQDTSSKAEVPTKEEEKKKQQKKKPFYVTAGLGLQQQIPVGGQDAFPYNYYGRKGSLSDYIPSAYVRLHKENKWFIQAEFRYGAPQSVKDFSYSRQTVYDTSTQSLATTSLYLRKTYYHQIPLSFNYYVRPNWSVGVGGVYSRFYGAVTEEEVKSRNVFTQAEKISKRIVQIPEYNDSFLYKTQVHFLIQTDYQWKRFSFGLRYKKDIQPYIKYTQPDGRVDVKKNQSLEAIIRFRIFRTRIFGM
jgi:hypothetical protein